MEGRREKTDATVDRSVRLLAYLGGIMLLWLMGLTVVAVVMRYVFNAPILGAQDISELSLVLVVFFALAHCGWTGGHVAVDLIGTVLKPETLRWTDTLVRAISGLLFVYVTWQTMRQGLDALEFGEASNLVEIPHFPFILVVAFGSAVYALVLLVQAVRVARGLPDMKMQ
ncbi:MAG: TRAP transporter small permease [Candidatus Methylomirabilales bacterium]